MLKKSKKKEEESPPKKIKRIKAPSKEAGVFQDLISYQTYLKMRKADDEELSASKFQAMFPYLADFVRETKDLT